LVWDDYNDHSGQIFDSGRVLKDGRSAGYVYSLEEGFKIILELKTREEQQEEKERKEKEEKYE
jgi:hypothetical protein